MQNNVEQIKDRLNIVDVVSEYIQLQKAGMNFRARCPFHQERTPSFFVSPTRNTYHCFGCSRGGDMFTFVQEMEGVDFKGALSLLAPQAGVTLEQFDAKQASERDTLHALMEAATVFYQRNLTQHKGALAYLYKRGLTADTLKEFRIGFAQDEWSTLRYFLSQKGYTDVQMEKAGLVISGNRGYYDRFRSRIMFPITDTTGRAVGFSGRIFGTEDDKMGKYINSPETQLFNKSRILYGFDKAKEAIRKQGRVVLVEGQMDVLLSHQEGVLETVAASGTAFSDAHAQTLSRLSEKAILAFDDDSAGLSATERSAIVLLARGLDVRAVQMDAGTDPADMILADKNAWEQQVADAKHVVTFMIEKMRGIHADDERAFKKESSKRVLPLVKSIKDSIDREHFISHVAHVLRVPDEAVREELSQIDIRAQLHQTTEPSTENTTKEEVAPKTRKEILEEHIASIILWQKKADEPRVDVKKAEQSFIDAIGEDRAHTLLSAEGAEMEERIFEVELYFNDAKDMESELQELVSAVGREYVRDLYTQATRELQDAEAHGDDKKVKELLKKCQELSEKMHTLP